MHEKSANFLVSVVQKQPSVIAFTSVCDVAIQTTPSVFSTLLSSCFVFCLLLFFTIFSIFLVVCKNRG